MSKKPVRNTVEFEVYGPYALFSDVLTRASGEKCTYMLPTYEALKGIIQSVYFKPTIIWVIDEVRIMNKIDYESVKNSFVHPVKGEQSLVTCRYVSDPYYQVSGLIELKKGKMLINRNCVN